MILAIVWIFVLVVLLIYNICRPTPREKYFAKCVDVFDVQKMTREIGNTVLRIERFFDENDTPTLYSRQQDTTTLNSWITSAGSKHGWMSKLKFTPGSNVLGDYVLKWLETQPLPKDLKRRLASDQQREYALRITSGTWHFPRHFDGSDNYLVILAGQRQGVMDGERRYTLDTGDAFYIPGGIEHEFWCGGSRDQLNILFNVCFEVEHETEKTKLVDKFQEKYPKQYARNEQRVDYT